VILRGQLNPTLRIVVDHEGLRGFARIHLTTEGFEVDEEAADGETALAAVHALHPDVVLLDVGLPDIGRLKVARRLAQKPGAPSLVLTSRRNASDDGQPIADSPARGFLSKQELPDAAISALVTPIAARRLKSR